DGLLIDIDLALVIPAYKKPLWYELDVYLKDRGWSMSVETVQLLNSKEIFNYVVRSEIECRLSYGENETKLLNQFDVNSVMKQSVRVCKILRNTYMAHYFDIYVGDLSPIMPSYWIKTVAMHLFNVYKPMEFGDLDQSCLGQCVMKILQCLYKCLTGDDGKHRPFLASFNDPFKNLLNEPVSDSEEARDLDDDFKNVLCYPYKVLADNISDLLLIFERMQDNDQIAKEDLKKMEMENNQEKIRLLEKGKRQVLGYLIYRHVITLERDNIADSPWIEEYLIKNLPTIQIRHGEETKVEINCIDREINFKLFEDGVEMDYEEVLGDAFHREQFFSNQRIDKNLDKYFFELARHQQIINYPDPDAAALAEAEPHEPVNDALGDNGKYSRISPKIDLLDN
ncbi:MAG: hypothetical protein AAFY76_14285, partial [Cyanobacteria bacterium J06649_11]